jgi:hypothetical protein
VGEKVDEDVGEEVDRDGDDERIFRVTGSDLI